MPQLDFFTFPHQYLTASLCFFGLYYFNLLFFFARIRFFHFNKLFSLNGLLVNNFMELSELAELVQDLFLLQQDSFKAFKKKNRRLQKRFFVKKISTLHTKGSLKNNQTLLLTFAILFFFIFFFFKNFLIFNAEKLMLMYFLLIAFSLTLVLKSLLKGALETDLTKFLVVVLEIEMGARRNLILLSSYAEKLRIDTIANHLTLVLLRNLELKIIKKFK
jgi:hypothetical protein